MYHTICRCDSVNNRARDVTAVTYAVGHCQGLYTGRTKILPSPIPNIQVLVDLVENESNCCLTVRHLFPSVLIICLSKTSVSADIVQSFRGCLQC